jgi:Rrf2 family transcriptional regulator, iron-sulfur cluster assembly transcription factor
MRITNAEDYALRTVLHLAAQPEGRFCAIEAIAREQEIPAPFLRKLVRPLQQAGLLVARRGADGGVALGRPAARISFRQVLEALDGPIALQRCSAPEGAGDGPCRIAQRCRMREAWRQIEARFLESLDAVHVGDLVGRERRLAGAAARRLPVVG